MPINSHETSFNQRRIHYKSFIYRSALPLQLRFSRLLLFKKWAAGRSKSGTRLLRSKGGRSQKYRYPFINFSFRFTSIAFFMGYFFVPFRQKLCAILYLSSGHVTHTLVTETRNHPQLFNLAEFTSVFKKVSFKLKEITTLKPFLKIIQAYFLILMLRKNTPVSLLELYPLKGIEYARSAGARAMILKMDTRDL